MIKDSAGMPNLLGKLHLYSVPMERGHAIALPVSARRRHGRIPSGPRRLSYRPGAVSRTHARTISSRSDSPEASTGPKYRRSMSTIAVRNSPRRSGASRSPNSSSMRSRACPPDREDPITRRTRLGQTVTLWLSSGASPNCMTGMMRCSSR
jgi:hypothetical protein